MNVCYILFFCVLCCSKCLFSYGPFCHGALKLDLSTLFAIFFVWTSLQFILLLLGSWMCQHTNQESLEKHETACGWHVHYLCPPSKKILCYQKCDDKELIFSWKYSKSHQVNHPTSIIWTFYTRLLVLFDCLCIKHPFRQWEPGRWHFLLSL